MTAFQTNPVQRSPRALTRAAAVGFTVKSGWACAVLMGGPASSPRLLDSRRIDLSDPAVPAARQPYHAGFGTARRAGRELTRLVASVEGFGRQSVADLVRMYRRDGHDLRGAGIVVGSLIDPNEIANAHIRIHALEGRLFRRVVEKATARTRLSPSTWRERDLYALAVPRLKRSEPHLRRMLTTLGRETDGPWRAEHKVAALAACLVLAGISIERTA